MGNDIFVKERLIKALSSLYNDDDFNGMTEFSSRKEWLMGIKKNTIQELKAYLMDVIDGHCY